MEKSKKRSREYKNLHKTEINKTFREQSKICRQIVLQHYSNGDIKCNHCGFTDERALTIDHINGGGQKHKKILKGVALSRWLVKQKFPVGYQVLCMNCQRIKVHENNELPYYIKNRSDKITV